jgi:5-methylcytosine-specific restriction endonuclease McrA
VSIPFFRRNTAPPLRPRNREARETHRGSARERGYTTEWDVLSASYRRAKPFCEECKRRGYLVVCDVVDHMVPIEDDPERRLDEENLDSLCHPCHNGWKRRIEAYARQTGQIDMLPAWIKQPEYRPPGFTIFRTGPVKQDGTIA